METVRVRLARIFEIGAGNRRILSMEGLRGLAVLLVFFVHYESLFGNWLARGGASAAVGQFLETVGHTGVDLFFVLSGYLIYGACIKKRESYGKFMERRVRRIYPTFLVLLSVYVVLSILVPSESKLPPGRDAAIAYVIENALLVPGIFNVTPLVTVAWSLSYEFFYYLVIPLLVGVLGMRLWPAGRRVGFFVALAAAFATHCFIGGEHVQLLLFASGILVYEGSRSKAVARIAAHPRAQVVAFALLLSFLPVSYAIVKAPVAWLPARLGARYTLLACWLFVALFVVTLCAFAEGGRLRSLFSVTPLRWLGNMSYSYYLVHGLTLKGLAVVTSHVFARWHPGALAHWAFLPCAFAATLVASTGLFVAIEKRFSLTPTDKPATHPALPILSAAAGP